MLNQSDALRAMAAKYLRLAKDTKDPRERSKFFDYVMVYSYLSDKAERREMVELRDQSKQEDPAGSDSSRAFQRSARAAQRSAQGH